MKSFLIDLHQDNATSYYKQIYEYIKTEILAGNVAAGEKLPSLRSLSKSLGVSLTTTTQAYNQLLVEGYISSKPQSGYYVCDLSYGLSNERFGNLDQFSDSEAFSGSSSGAFSGASSGSSSEAFSGASSGSSSGAFSSASSGSSSGTFSSASSGSSFGTSSEAFSGSSSGAFSGGGIASDKVASGNYGQRLVSGGISENYDMDRLMDMAVGNRLYDLDAFDFNKWKKCTNRVLTDYRGALTFESDPQGEAALRFEISKYLYLSRGVVCGPEQIVIGAGTQQIMGHLARILTRMGINHVAVEEPGYLPVKNIFRERGFVMTPVAVGREGIDLYGLPMNIRSAVYVCPSNQFPTGAVMPIGKRYELLDWAARNNSFIIEDDYDSELRYFGRPVPALQGLDRSERVVYLGSFSSTLFPAVKISYMVLTPSMVSIFEDMRGDYTQTCSKTEQLTLALFMEKGFYQTGLRKMRNLYAQKLAVIADVVEKYGCGRVALESASSGLNVVLRVSAKEEESSENRTSLFELQDERNSLTKSADQLCEEAKALGLQAVPVSVYADETTDSREALVLYYHQIPLSEIETRLARLFATWLS